MPAGIEIVSEDEGARGAYRAQVPGAARPAELAWIARGNTRIATRTYVPPEARGQGIAMRLVEALIADARAKGFTIVPQCSYVEAAFRRRPDWAGLLAPAAG